MPKPTKPNARSLTLEVVFGLRLLRPVIFVGLLIIGATLGQVMAGWAASVWVQLQHWGVMLCRG